MAFDIFRPLALATMMVAGTFASAEAPRPDPPRMQPKVLMKTIPARPEDVSSVEAIVDAFYAAVNVAPDAPRLWDRDHTLYSPWIRFVGVYENGRHEVWTHQELVDNTEPLIASGFRERETHRTVRRYGNIAHVESVYEGEVGPEHVKFRGINSLELYFDGSRWWIASVLWQSEHKGLPLPANCETSQSAAMCER